MLADKNPSHNPCDTKYFVYTTLAVDRMRSTTRLLHGQKRKENLGSKAFIICLAGWSYNSKYDGKGISSVAHPYLLTSVGWKLLAESIFSIRLNTIAQQDTGGLREWTRDRWRNGERAGKRLRMGWAGGKGEGGELG